MGFGLVIFISVSFAAIVAKLLLAPEIVLFNKSDKVHVLLVYSSPVFREKKHKTLFTLKKI